MGEPATCLMVGLFDRHDVVVVDVRGRYLIFRKFELMGQILYEFLPRKFS